jgi:hypothetical protein
MKSAYASIGAARAALFPRISLTSTIGTASDELSGLFKPGTDTWAFAPQLVARSADGLSREVPAARMWSLILVAVPLLLTVILVLPGMPRPDLIIAGGLAVRLPSRSTRRCTRI